MSTRLLVLTTEGGSREDGNVYYSRYVLVQSDILTFDEPIFNDRDFGPRSLDSGDPNNESFLTQEDRENRVLQIITDLGYTVSEPDTVYVEMRNG